MRECQFVIEARPNRGFPARLSGLLLPLEIELIGMQVDRIMDPDRWCVHLTVHLTSDRQLEFVAKRLNRLVDVERVVVIKDRNICRQSVCVTLRPNVSDMASLWSLAHEFGAEPLDIDEERVLLHLNAAPDRCTSFVSKLRRYRVTETTTSAVSVVSPSTRSSQNGLRNTDAAYARHHLPPSKGDRR